MSSSSVCSSAIVHLAPPKETAGRTRIELEHRNLDRHGAGWEGERDGIAGEGGWPLYLQRFGDLLKD